MYDTILLKKINWRSNVSSRQISGVTGIVLAGGKSSRLGREKALEKVGNQRLIEKVVSSLCPISQEVFVVTSQEQFGNIGSIHLKARTLVDLYPGKAAFGGIYTGLVSANNPYGLVVACDMPFLNSALLSYMVGLTSGFDAVVPKINDKLELLHAIYSKNCLAIIKQMLDKDILQVLQLLDLVKTRYVCENEVDKYDPEHLSFFNINTQNDLLEAEKIMERHDRKG